MARHTFPWFRQSMGLLIFSLACGGGGGGNNAPKPTVSVTSVPKTAATEGHPYHYTITATSPQGGIVQYTLVNSPSGATLTGSSVDWTPGSSVAGTNQAFRVKADDGTSSQEQSWSVVVSANLLPSFSSTPPATAKEAHGYSYTLVASDADSDTVQFQGVQLPTGATLVGNQLTWTPTATQVGPTTTFKVRVLDGFGGSQDQSWSVAVSANSAPVFSNNPPTVATAVHPYSYALAASDADGDSVQFQSILFPAGASLNGNQLTWTPSATDAGMPTAFKVRALDGLGGVQDQEWSVTPSANALPVITSQPPSDVSFVQGAPIFDYALTGTDANGDVISYSLIQAPGGATLANGMLHWQPTPSQERVPQTFQIRASDGYGGTCDQQWTKAYSGVARGTWSDSYLAPSGAVVTRTNTNSGYNIYALVPVAGAGYLTVNGAKAPDGTWSIPGIPPGGYWLFFGSRGFLWTDQSQIDMGMTFLGGRPDAVLGSDSAPLSLTFSGLSSWSDFEGMRWVVANQGVQTFLSSSAFTSNAPHAGDTALSSAILARIANTALVDASKLDELTLLQTHHSAQGGFYDTETIQKAFTTNTLTQVLGTTTPLTGAFTAPSVAGVDLVWNGNLDASHKDQFHPGSWLNQPTLMLVAQPGGMEAGLAQGIYSDLDGFYSSHPSLMQAFAIAPAMFQQPLVYGDPFPSSWTRIFITHTALYYNLLVNGGTYVHGGTMMMASDSPGSAAAPLQNQLSPVQNPSINGQSLFVDQVSVGTQPVLTWDPPSNGVPSLYQIRFQEILSGGGGISFANTFAYNLSTMETTVQVPPGILQAGSMYVINIRAVATGNVGVKNAPFRLALPLSIAESLSAVIRP